MVTPTHSPALCVFCFCFCFEWGALYRKTKRCFLEHLRSRNTFYLALELWICRELASWDHPLQLFCSYYRAASRHYLLFSPLGRKPSKNIPLKHPLEQSLTTSYSHQTFLHSQPMGPSSHQPCKAGSSGIIRII